MAADAQTPSPVNYGKLYGESYYGEGRQTVETISRYDLSNILESKMPQARAALRLIQRFQVRGRLLDVGCSAGVFVKAAVEAGFDATGIDISEVAVRFAREQLGVEARVAMLETEAFDSQQFDVITLWDVLEHFEDPWRAMRIVDGLLAPGGIVALRTPNTHCLRTVLCGFRSWDMVSPPEHYHLFARKSLEMFLGQFDYRLVHLSTVHSRWLYYQRPPALMKFPIRLSGAVGLGGDLLVLAKRTS